MINDKWVSEEDAVSNLNQFFNGDLRGMRRTGIEQIWNARHWSCLLIFNMRIWEWEIVI